MQETSQAFGENKGLEKDGGFFGKERTVQLPHQKPGDVSPTEMLFNLLTRDCLAIEDSGFFVLCI